MERLVILGTSGNAEDIVDVLEAINARQPTWEVTGFLDDQRAGEWMGVPVLGPLGAGGRFPDMWFINAIGSDGTFRRRPELVAGTGIRAERFATLVHPGACVSPRARLGRGVCVNAGAIISSGAILEDHVWVGAGGVIGHGTMVGTHSVVAPGALISGAVEIGRACYIGGGAVIRQRVKVGAGALVGLGAVVLRDVAEGQVVVGNPARVLRVAETKF